MRTAVGVDTNVLAYLVQAARGTDDPAADSDPTLKSERVAAYRVFRHSPGIAVTPTVAEEVEQTANPAERADLAGWKTLLNVEILALPPDAVEARAQGLRPYHDEERDCRIVAEAEIGGLAVLLTFDRTLRKRLDDRSPTVRVRYPSEYWGELQSQGDRLPITRPDEPPA